MSGVYAGSILSRQVFSTARPTGSFLPVPGLAGLWGDGSTTGLGGMSVFQAAIHEC